MRCSSGSCLVFATIVSLAASAPANPAAAANDALGIARARSACPSTLAIVRHDPSDYIVVFDAPRRSIATFRIRAYAPGADEIADLPLVALSTPYATARGTRFRSRAFDVRPLGNAPLSAATVRATFAGAARNCPSEDRLIGAENEASFSAVIVARDDAFAREAMTSAPTMFRAARTTRFSCSRPFAAPSVVRAAMPAYPSGANGASGEVVVGVGVGPSNVPDSFTTIRSSGSDALDRAALRAAKISTYAAATIGCRPRAGSTVFVATFTGR